MQPRPTDRQFDRHHLDTDASTDEEEVGQDARQDGSDNERVSRQSPDVDEREALGSAGNVSGDGIDRCDCRPSDASKAGSLLFRRTQRVAPSPRTSTAIRWKSYDIDHGTWIIDWLCDDCGQRALDGTREGAGSDADKDAGGDNVAPFTGRRHRRSTHLVEPVDVDRPHVWSFGGRRRDWSDGDTDLLSAEHLDDDDFVVPGAATYALDPHILSALPLRQTASAPNVRGCEGFLAGIGSVRGWMPLWGAHEVIDDHCRHSTRMLMICCDARHPAWGSVAVIYINTRSFVMTWYAAESSLECLVARWRAHPMRLESARFAKDWVAWACVFYVDAGVRTEMARVVDGHNEDAVALENMMDEGHALSDKPWAWLLDRGEYDAFFASEDAVDGALDLDDNAHASQRHLRKRRKERRHRRRTRRIGAP